MIRVHPLEREPVGTRPALCGARGAGEPVPSGFEVHLSVNVQCEPTEYGIYRDSEMPVVCAFLI